MTKILLPGIFLICFISCRERLATPQQVSDTLFYNTTVESEALLDVQTMSCQGFISNQQLNIRITVKKTKKDFILTPDLWELSDSEEIRSLPVRSTVIADKQSGILNIDLVYAPVGSRKLFQHTGLRGDLKREYCLHITDPNGGEIKQKICIEANDTIHKKSVEKFGIAATTTPYVLVKLDVPSDAGSANMKVVPVQGNQPLISGNEILTRGFWTKFSGYYKNDTLHFHFRMVNQSSHGLIIKKESISLINGASVLKPAYSQEPVIELRNGGRADLFLKFVVEKNTEYALDLRGMQFNTPAQESIFDHRVIFTALADNELP